MLYVYKWAAGKPQRIRLGRFPELTVEQAQHLARATLGDIANGRDPQAEKVKARNVPTLRELFEKWVEVYAKPHRKRWADDKRQFEKYLPPLHGRRLDSIRPADVAVWHGKVGTEHGPVQANRVLGLLTTLYNKAEEVIGYEGSNPCSRIKRFAEQSRDRFLQADELPRFFRAVEAEPEAYRDFFLVALFTGCAGRTSRPCGGSPPTSTPAFARIPETKAGVPVVIPLSDAAMEVLRRRWASNDGSPWVFPANSRPGHLVEPRKSWQRILKTAGLENLEDPRLAAVPRLLAGPHRVKPTCHWQELGASRHRGDAHLQSLDAGPREAIRRHRHASHAGGRRSAARHATPGGPQGCTMTPLKAYTSSLTICGRFPPDCLPWPWASTARRGRQWWCE